MGKRIYIGHESAQAFWRAHDGEVMRSLEQILLPAPYLACTSIRTIAACELDASVYLPDGTLTLLVANASERRPSKHVTSRLWNHPCTYYRIADGVYVSSPEDTMLQLASNHSFNEALLYNFELTGTYARQSMLGGTVYNRKALCSVADLERCAQGASRIPGLPMLREAIRFTLGNSASPMESTLTIELTLPADRSGFAFEAPVLNQRIVTTKSGRYRVGDLYWPKQGVDLEYQSDSYHAGYDKAAQDGMRANELVALNNKVLQASFDHFRIPGAMEVLAAQLSKALGCASPDDTSFARAQRADLQKELLAIDGIRLGSSFRR